MMERWENVISWFLLISREMQVQASVTYEEPWDNRKQQEKLQTKMKKPSPKSGDRLSSQKSSSEAHTQTKASSLSKSPTPNLPPSLPPNHPTAPNPSSIRSQLPSLPLDQPPSLPDCPAPSLYETPWDRGKQQEHLQVRHMFLSVWNKKKVLPRRRFICLYYLFEDKLYCVVEKQIIVCLNLFPFS